MYRTRRAEEVQDGLFQHPARATGYRVESKGASSWLAGWVAMVPFARMVAANSAGARPCKRWPQPAITCRPTSPARPATRDPSRSRRRRMAQHWRRQAMRSPANSKRVARASARNPSGGRRKTGLDRCLSRRHPHSARQARRSSHTTGARTDEVPGNLWRCAPTDTLDEECPQSDGLKLAGNTVRKRTTRTAAAAILRHCLGDASRQM